MKNVHHKKARCRHEKKLLLKRVCKQEAVLKQATDLIFNQVGQELSLAKMKLAMSKVEQPPCEKERITETHNLVGKAITDLRRLGNELNEVIDFHPGLQSKAV